MLMHFNFAGNVDITLTHLISADKVKASMYRIRNPDQWLKERWKYSSCPAKDFWRYEV